MILAYKQVYLQIKKGLSFNFCKLFVVTNSTTNGTVLLIGLSVVRLNFIL